MADSLVIQLIEAVVVERGEVVMEEMVGGVVSGVGGMYEEPRSP